MEGVAEAGGRRSRLIISGLGDSDPSRTIEGIALDPPDRTEQAFSREVDAPDRDPSE